MSLTLVTAPTVDPLTEAEVWAHLRVDLIGSPAAPADQSHISALITAATSYLDGRSGILGRALVTQTWDLRLDSFPLWRSTETGYQGNWGAAAAIHVPLPPLQSVTSITYIATDGTSTTLDPSLYTVDPHSEPGRISPSYGNYWPICRLQQDAVTVRFVAGYDPTNASPADYRANVPRAIRQAMLLLIGHWYNNREEVIDGRFGQTPVAADALLAPFRMYSVP